MPLIGVVDPSHNERLLDDYGRPSAWLTKDEVLEKALHGDPRWSPWPYELLKAALDVFEDRDYISVTMLTGGCARGKVLERREDFIIDFDSMYAALKGTQIHRTLEHASRPGSVAEYRFFTTLDVGARQVELSCSPDIVIYEGSPTILDWKTTENPPTYDNPKKYHRRQVEFNRYMVNNSERWHDADGNETSLPFNPWELKFEHLAIVYLGPKWPKVLEVTKTQQVKFKNGNTGPRKQPYVADDEEVLGDLMPRLRAMVLALDAYPEWPDELTGAPGFEGEPGWRCPGPPHCWLPNCLAKRYPNGLSWENPS